VTRRPDFDDLVGTEVPAGERERLRRVHDLLVEAGPPPELSPELEAVPWPEDALQPLFGRRKEKHWTRRPLVLAAAFASALVLGLLLGQATSNGNSIDVQRTVALQGTALAKSASGKLELGKADKHGNWPMVLHVSNLKKLPEGGYYDLYLTKRGKPVVLCGTFNVGGKTEVRFTAAYDLQHFDKNGWVVTRQPAGHFKPDQIVLRPKV
jgi:Anti-sigma-K factor rskA